MEKIEKAEVLQEMYIMPESVYDGTFSKTAQFMIPSIGITITKPIVFKYFVNAYLNDSEHPHDYLRPIFMLFSIKNYKEADWVKVYNQMIQSPNYVTEYDVGMKGEEYLLMMVFKVPDEYEDDYINFKMGRYSKFSDKYKEKFPEFLDKERKRKNIHWQIMNKDEELKRKVEKEYNMDEGELDMPTMYRGKIVGPPAEEIWDKPNKKREVYRNKEMQLE